MRTTPALRTLTAAVVAGGAFAAAAAGTTATAAPAPPTRAPALLESPAFDAGHGGRGSGGPIRGTVVSGTALYVRAAPTTHAPAVDELPPGSEDRVRCVVKGQRVNGDPYWYWLTGAQGWASAAFVDTGGRSVPYCADPCPQWKDGPQGGWSNWGRPLEHPSWTAWSWSGTVSWSVSGSWSRG